MPSTKSGEILETMNTLARVYQARKKHKEAGQLLKEDIRKKKKNMEKILSNPRKRWNF